MENHDTQPVYRLHDFIRAQFFQPNMAYCEAGRVNRIERLHLVIDSVCPDTNNAGDSTVPALADGAGGSPIG